MCAMVVKKNETVIKQKVTRVSHVAYLPKKRPDSMKRGLKCQKSAVVTAKLHILTHTNNQIFVFLSFGLLLPQKYCDNKNFRFTV